MENTIYVIVKGHYSDYLVCAATTNKERAEIIRQLHTDDYYTAKILAFESGNSYVNEARARTYWHIDIVKKGKEIKETCDVCTLFDDYEDKDHHVFNAYVNGDFGFEIIVAEPDKDKAMKIARDRLAECKAKFFEV